MVTLFKPKSQALFVLKGWICDSLLNGYYETMNSYICSGAQVHSHYVTHLLCESSNNKSNNKITLMMRKILLFTLFKAEKSTHTHKIYTSLSNLVFGSRSCHISFISSGCLVVNGRYCQNVRIAFVRIFNNPGRDRERPKERETGRKSKLPVTVQFMAH